MWSPLQVDRVKALFGFPKNPFIAQKEKLQVKKYLEHLGLGIIVYEIGFQKII